MSNIREYHRFLLERCDTDMMSNMSSRVAAVHNRRQLDQMQIFVSGSTEDSNIAIFMNDIRKLSVPWLHVLTSNREYDMKERALSSFLDALTLNGGIKYLAGPRAMELAHPLTQYPAHSLAVMYVASVFSGSDQGASNARALKMLIVEALKHGCNLHQQSSDGTPFLHLLPTYTGRALSRHDIDGHVYSLYKNMDNALRIWLELLESIGIDLTSYGQEEERLFRQLRRKSKCDQPWHKWHTCVACGHYDEYGNWHSSTRPCSTLIAFTYGATISDWKLWVVHRGDEYAGQFWRIVEQDNLKIEGLGHHEQYMPGGWIESKRPGRRSCA